MKTPAQIYTFLDTNSYKMDLPAQYLGDEPNAALRDWDTASVRWCVVACWPYEQAAGNQSIPAVYKAIHDHDPHFLCDRFYLPATPGDMRILQKAGIGVFGIESKHPLADFDIVGTSISYPVLAINLIKMLTISDIPVRWKDRDHTHPMVMAGGLSYGAPEVLAPVVDCWFLGEAEDEPGNPGIGAVTDRIAAFRRTGRWRDDRVACYADLAREFNFLYFPRFVDVHYNHLTKPGLPHPSKQPVAYTGNLDGMRLPLRKRHVGNLDSIAPLDNPPLLYADPAMGSGDIEVARSCPAWCSFCSLAWKSKPYRQRSIDYVLKYATDFQDNMGSTRMAPFSPDLPMYTQRRALIAGLLEQVNDEVDAASMRVDDYIADNTFILLQVHGGLDSVTLGVEGNSQRMRDLLGKGTSDEEIREAVRRAITAGIRKIKLYMISNLPGEDEGDVYRILKLAKDLADIRDSMNQPTVRIQFSWTPLMIEANTPMQWFAPQVQSRVLGDMWDEFRDLKIEFKIGAKAEVNKASFFQACQRASRDVGEALVDAIIDIDQGCWGGVPRTFKDLIETKLHERGFTNGYGDIFDEREQHDMFGWEFIDTGVSTKLLWRNYVQMREFAENTDSHTYETNFDSTYHGSEWTVRCDQKCSGKSCGACTYADLKERNKYLHAVDTDIDITTLKTVDQTSQMVRIRARIHKGERYRFVGNDHWRFALRRACYRATTALGQTWGVAKRSIRFASDEVKYRDWTYGTDYVEFGLTAHVTEAQISRYLDQVQTELGDSLRLSQWRRHPLNAVTIRNDVGAVMFSTEADVDITTLKTRIDWWKNTPTIDMRLKIDGGYFAPNNELVNARDYVDDLWVVPAGHRLTISMILKPRPNPYNIIAALMGKQSWLPYAKHAAHRTDIYLPTDPQQIDFLRPACSSCGNAIPVNLLDQPTDTQHCPPCHDRHTHPGTFGIKD